MPNEPFNPAAAGSKPVVPQAPLQTAPVAPVHSMPVDAEPDEIVTTEDAPAGEIPQETIDAQVAAAAAPEAPAEAIPAAASEPEARPFGAGLKDAASGGLSLDERAQMTKEKLMREPRLRVIVPLSPGEKPGAVKVASINGYRFEIKKGQEVELPETVWNLIAKSMKASVMGPASHPMNLQNADSDKREALGMK